MDPLMNGSVLSISVEHHRIPLASKWINAVGLLVVCTDQEALNWRADDIGHLRAALDELVRVFRLDRSR